MVARASSYDACTVLSLEGVGATAGQRLTLIEPFDRLRILQQRHLRLDCRQHVLRVARSAIASARPANGLWTAADSRITLLPYQLEPALAVLDGATRVLLADAVGLGKTVQAGLILAELRARGFVNRALVVTPAGLRHAWVAELRDRFGLAAAIVDQAAMTNQPWLATADVNPWTCHHIVVASVDFVKRPDVLPSVEAAPFDLLIADEVHHLTPGSDRGAAVGRLAARAPWVILASATPHSGDEPAFAFLKSLGAHNDRLTIFRRTRADIGMPHSRRSLLLAVTPTRDETAMFAAIDRYTDAIWRGRGLTDPSAQLVAITLRRRAASSANALLRTLTRRRELLSAEVEPPSSQPSLPWEETETDDADGPDVVLAAPGLDDTAEERRSLDRLVELAQGAVVNPSKIQRVRRLIARAREPVVVFTEYRDTLDALVPALGHATAVAVIHGGLPIDLRHGSIERFTTGDADVLVATDAAGEGLNLQHRCRLVINMEMPWNPLRLEQRVGRVDRIGQTRRVHAIHLFHRNTVEDTVLARLERRRLRARSALADINCGWFRESDIASIAFGATASEPHPPLHLPSVHVSRAADELRRLEEQRAWSRAAGVGNRPVWTSPRRRPASARLVWLYEARLAASCGLTVEHRVETAVLELSRGLFNRREWRRLIQVLERSGLVAPNPAVHDRESLDAVESFLRPFRARVVARLDAIRSGLARARRRQWQGSLFDRRVECDEERRLDALKALDTHFARKVSLFKGLTLEGEPVRRRLVAVWPFDVDGSKGQGRPPRDPP